MSLFWQWIDRFLLPIDDPGSRLFGLNLLASLVMLALFQRASKEAPLWQQVKAAAFSRRYWWNASTKVDYQFYFLNSLLKIMLVVPFLQLSFTFSTLILAKLISLFGLIPTISPNVLSLLCFSIFAFVFDDLLRFAQHLAMHRIPFLWNLHRVHHSATVLTPITLYRLHPVESLLSTARNSLSAGVSLGVFLFLFDGESSLHALLGTATFGLLFNFLGANLRHSHVALSFGRWEKYFISPAQHQLHHDRNAYFGVNFGVSLAIWDSLLGSLVFYHPRKKIRFGLRPFFTPALEKRKSMKIKHALASLASFFALFAFVSVAWGDKPKILIYDLAEQNYADAFTELAKEMGIEVEVSHGPAAILLSNLKDPENPEKPDFVIQQDALNLQDLSRLGLLSPMASPALEAAIPAQYHDLSKGWVGLSYHARTLAYNPDLVGGDEVKRYEDLADPKWQGKLCLRKATHSYTRALIASMIAGNGEAATEKVLSGWVANNDKPIYVGDLYVMQALDAGDCVFGLVNTDFFARYKAMNPESNLKLLWMNQGDRGAHVNITGMALTVRSQQRELALRFLEKVAAHEVTMVRFADIKKAYPTNPAFHARSGIVESFGPFKADSLSMLRLGELEAAAKALAIKVGYNP